MSNIIDFNTKPIVQTVPSKCSFCGRTKSKDRAMVEDNGHAICVECVMKCNKLLEAHDANPN